MDVYLYVCLFARLCVCMYVCLYACVFVCAYAFLLQNVKMRNLQKINLRLKLENTQAAPQMPHRGLLRCTKEILPHILAYICKHSESNLDIQNHT